MTIMKKTRDKEYYDYAENSSQYILDQLKLYENKKILCFSYIPGSNVIVHNVNMLGACFLARIYSYNNNYELFEKSKKAMYFSMKDLSNNFMWKYGKESHHSFIDNFHTGFNLVALKKWMDFTGDTLWRKELKNAYNRWISSFWLENGIPKYYINSVFPIDIHCCAQGIITHYNLSEYNTKSNEWIKKIAYWAIKNMQDKKGYFYYQITRLYKNRIPYIRWSQAWMFYSLALLNSDEKKKNV